jgi:IS30 family transposase
VIDLLEPLTTYTLTADNGKEFVEHQRIAEGLQLDVYFAHPYAALERGANENMNGLIRQYIPKDRDLATVVSEEDLVMIINKLNHRPRKCLDFQTPFEVFFQKSVALMS